MVLRQRGEDASKAPTPKGFLTPNKGEGGKPEQPRAKELGKEAFMELMPQSLPDYLREAAYWIQLLSDRIREIDAAGSLAKNDKEYTQIMARMLIEAKPKVISQIIGAGVLAIQTLSDAMNELGDHTGHDHD